MSKNGPTIKNQLTQQAQIAVFANERMPRPEFVEVIGNLPEIARGDQRLADQELLKTDYIKFLKEVKGTQYSAISKRIEILTSYTDFKDEIDRLKDELNKFSNQKEHPDFLGAGGNCRVFKITKDQKDYAVRINCNPDSYIDTAHLVADLPGTEKIVAASYEDRVTIAEILPGEHMGKLKTEDLKAVTDQQLENLVTLVIELNRRGVEIDPKPSNFHYDPDAGYGILDMSSAHKVSKSSQDQSPKILSSIATALDCATFFGQHQPVIRSKAEYQNEANRKELNTEIMKRCLLIIDKKFNGEEKDQIKTVFQEKIRTNEETIANYREDQWVEEDQIKWINYEKNRYKTPPFDPELDG